MGGLLYVFHGRLMADQGREKVTEQPHGPWDVVPADRSNDSWQSMPVDMRKMIYPDYAWDQFPDAIRRLCALRDTELPGTDEFSAIEFSYQVDYPQGGSDHMGFHVCGVFPADASLPVFQVGSPIVVHGEDLMVTEVMDDPTDGGIFRHVSVALPEGQV